MLQKNKLFLKLLGSFYDQTADTDFSSRLDYIYTSILLNRYVSILRRKVLSDDKSSIPDSIHFGFINSGDINPSTGEIVIRNIKEEIVESVNFISLAYLDIENFYPVDDNKVPASAISEMSMVSSNIIPVVYMVDAKHSYFKNGIISFVDSATENETVEIDGIVLRIISDQIAYFPNTVENSYKAINILLGAIYSNQEEEVLSVSDDIVATTRNVYSLTGINQGRAIVSVGDIVKGSDLITSLSSISNDISFIDDITKIKIYMSAAGISPTNSAYLRKISSALAKRKFALVVPPEVFSEVDTSVISIIGKLFNVKTAFSVFVSLVEEGQDEISYNEGYKLLFVDSHKCDVVASGGWILEIPDHMNTDITEEQGLLFTIEEETIAIDDFDLQMVPLYDITNIDVNEQAINIIETSASTDMVEELQFQGDLVDTYVGTVDESHTNIPNSHEDTMSASDYGPVFDSGTVSLKDTIGTMETDTKMVSASDATSAILSGIVNTIASELAIVSIDGDLVGNVSIVDFSVIEYDSKDSFVNVDNAVFNTIILDDPNDAVSINLSDTFSVSESSLSQGNLTSENNAIIWSEETANGNLITITDAVFLLDTSEVESDNIIDS